MKKLLLSLVLLIAVSINYGQDEKAKVVLDKLGEKTKTYTSLSIDFKLSIKAESTSSNVSGVALIKDQKYTYKTENGETFSDGKSVWTYEKEDNICYIDDMDEISGGLNPKELLTIWEQNYNYQYIKEDNSNGKVIHEIKLFPKKPGDSKFHTVILYIDGSSNELQKVYIKRKDGVTIQFTIVKMTPNLDIADSKFIWNKAKYPGVEENDNR